MRSLVLIASLALAGSALGQTSFYQLEAFKNSTNGPIGIQTTTYGVPVSVKDASNTLDQDILDNPNFLEYLSSFNRERIVQRVVHAKGAGARGFFKVTHDVTDITNAKLFSKIGKITPVSARFSPAISDRGTSDTLRGAYSISTKFYTEEGNWDFLGFSTDVFFVKDSLFFPSVLHANFKNPQTFLMDLNSFCDVFFQRTESFNFLMIIFGDGGGPGSYRNLPAYPIHTFQVENAKGEVHFVKFKLTPDLGETYLNQTMIFTLAGAYPSYYTQDLYDAIGQGEYPSWTLEMQVIPEADVDSTGFDIFDVTVRWPVDQYPFRPIGKYVLNQNPKNYFAEVEQLAFNPGNVVPGIQGVDQMFKARTFAYRDAQLYRLGVNYNKIEINCPLSKVYTYDRDGVSPVRDNFGGIPNYYPNAFNGPVPANKTRTTTAKYRPTTVPDVTNLGQAAEYWQCLSADAKERMISNWLLILSATYPAIQQRAIELFTQIDPTFGAALEAGFQAAAASGSSTGLPTGISFTSNFTCSALGGT